MSLKSNIPNTHLHTPLTPHRIISLLQRRTIQIREYPAWKHRRLKFSRSLRVRNQLSSSPFDNLFQSMLSQFSSADSLDLIAPALGFASGFALYLSRLTSNRSSQVFDIGEWILFTSPTPFNRFVMLRCPSISFNGSELLEDVNERLLKEDRHFVRLNSGRIQVTDSDENNSDSLEEKLVYQRLCVSTDDGGVISLDWPANLDLKEEHGLDTTLLLIPGTAEGSADKNIRSFVCECLNRGCFPVVMNPRGCAGSPLTTARLFTAADSDDVCTAIQFINGERPWTTLMGVGWGYGANMLTKYLAEVGEKTSLIAATCIDNPFDLEEATRSSPYHNAVHHKLTAGLVDILRSNKEIFQGRAKGFDVEKALLATSLRDFEKEISMISYGSNAIEDFYKKSSTRGVVGNVKIPLLFIQNDAGAVPQFSIPRSLIAENPFTSLLLCSCLNVTKNDKSTISWSQHLAIEWLAAVELGLLKGRHPLLKDVDVTINPSNGLALMDGKASKKNDRVSKLLNFPHLDDLKQPLRSIVEESDTSAFSNSRSRGDTQINYGVNDKVSQQEKSGALDAEAEIVKEEVGPVDSERGQVLQTAEVVLNMLDVTMPDTLTEEQKKKVLAAMGRGETLMNALQDAVPEDVRGKLTTAVSGILQNQGSNLKLEGLLNISQIPDILNQRGQSNEVGSSSKDDTYYSERADDLADSSNKNQPATGKSSDDLESELESSSENVQIPTDADSGLKAIDESGAATDENKKNIPETDVERNSSDSSTDEKMSSSNTDETLSASSSETQMVETEGSEIQQREEKSTQQQPPPVPTQTTSSNLPSFSVSQAFDALAGLDDSTQVAVNSVFTVIEDMITQLEVERDDGGVEVKDRSKENEQNKSSSSPKSEEDTKEREEDSNDDLTAVSDKLDDINSKEKKPIQQKAIVSGGDKIDNFGGRNLSSKVGWESGKGEQLVSSRISRRIPLSITTNPYGDSLYKEYLGQYLISKMQNTEPLDLDTTTALFLDYFPEEGQWKLLEQADPHKDVDSKVQVEGAAGSEDKIIEPSYVILDDEKQEDPVVNGEEDKLNESVLLVKNILLESLKVEVGRRLSAKRMEEMELNLAKDLDYVANSVSVALAHEEEFVMFIQGQASALENVSTVHGEHLIRAISSAVEETRYLRRVLPVGVIVGTSLASLRKLFNVAPTSVNCQSGQLVDENSSRERNSVQAGEIYNDDDDYEEVPEAKTRSINNNVMVGAVTAALGASALLAHQQGSYIGDEIDGTSIMSFGKKQDHLETDKLEEEMHEKNENNIVTSFTEKAMSVAGPVVPTKQGGGVDQERLVAMLAEWGQRGGMLRLVGKIALLWGGLRGATSLTDKLISFLHIAELPLLQRILGFVCMALILWTPVLVPLLPTLVQGWATHNSSKFAELACIIGLYVSIIILVRLWGKRIRGYENPLVQYGLDFTSTPKIQNFVKGLIGGVVLVLLMQSVNVFLGCVHLSLPSTPSSFSSSDAVTLFKVYGHMLIILAKGIVTATGVALVEELLFRSWLPDEIAVDLGYHRGVIISGLAFSLVQRSAWAAPGLWLLSLGLAGARERNQGSLSLPVGLRAGMIASSFIVQRGGFLRYQPNLPIWVTGSHPFEPFSGIVGMSFALFFAILLYPRQSQPKEETN